MSLFQAEKLIDLACSTSHEEEARTAALTACKMIRKLGLKLSPRRLTAPGLTPGKPPASAAREAAERRNLRPSLPQWPLRQLRGADRRRGAGLRRRGHDVV